MVNELLLVPLLVHTPGSVVEIVFDMSLIRIQELLVTSIFGDTCYKISSYVAN